jgi:riboflavin-specific deaminase-like protein
MQRLFPDPGPTTALDQVASLDLVSWGHQARPYVISNFVVTLDGRVTLEGRSGAIGSDSDTAMLVALRTRVDAVMIGAGTMRAECYGRIVRDPVERERRQRDGPPHDPLMVLVSGRLDLPWDAPLFTEGEGQVLIFTASDEEPPETATPIQVARHRDQVDLVAALDTLRREHGVSALLCEGGPRLLAQLIEAELIDELFITHAPKVAGGEGPRLVAGLPEAERTLGLAWLLHEPDTGELFARYRAGR